jgi:hypothetical protein
MLARLAGWGGCRGEDGLGAGEELGVHGLGALERLRFALGECLADVGLVEPGEEADDADAEGVGEGEGIGAGHEGGDADGIGGGEGLVGREGHL